MEATVERVEPRSTRTDRTQANAPGRLARRVRRRRVRTPPLHALPKVPARGILHRERRDRAEVPSGRDPRRRSTGAGEPLRQGYLAEEGETSVRIRMPETRQWSRSKPAEGVSHRGGDADHRRTGRRAGPTRPGARSPRLATVCSSTARRLVAEVDVYAGDLSGLYTVEVNSRRRSRRRVRTARMVWSRCDGRARLDERSPCPQRRSPMSSRRRRRDLAHRSPCCSRGVERAA